MGRQGPDMLGGMRWFFRSQTEAAGAHARALRRALLPVIAWIATGAVFADWPMWRADAGRTATTTDSVPRDPKLIWSLDLGPIQPTWPDEPRLSFDVAPSPVATDGRVFVASPRTESVIALDAQSGEKLWRFFANGPIRFAPAVAGKRVYVAADDGFLYALDAASGQILWRKRGGPSERPIVGNGSWISSWPARGAPVVADGVVYFAASIWPTMGVFVHAVDAETGATIWTNDGGGATFIPQPHDAPAFAGIAPQGYLAVRGDALVVPNGRAAPAVLDRATGELRFFHLSRNTRREDYHIATFAEHLVCGREIADLAKGDILTRLPARHAAFDGHAVYSASRFTAPGKKEGAPGAPSVRVVRHELRRALDLDLANFVVSWHADSFGMTYQVIVENAELRRVVARDERTDIARVLEPQSFHVESEYRDPAKKKHRAGVGYFVEQVSSKGRSLRRPWRFAVFFEQSEGAVWVEMERTRFIALEEIRRLAKKKSKSTTASKEAKRYRAGGETIDLYRGSTRSATEGGEVPRGWRDIWTLEERASMTSELVSATERPSSLPSIDEVRTIRAGVRTIVAVPGSLLVFSKDGNVEWRTALPGAPGDVIASEGRIFVSLVDGRILAFGEGKARQVVAKAASTKSFDDAPFAVVLGLKSRPVIDDLIRRGEHRIVVVAEREEAARSLREEFAAAGLYGRALVVRVRALDETDLPQYFASVACADARRHVGDVLRVLRPHGGVATLQGTPEDLESALIELRRLERTDLSIETTSAGITIQHASGPSGGGAWTHQYGDASNSNVSSDRLVRAPLGILWFGGPSNRELLPRHGHGPRPHVFEGRILVEGPDLLRALDVYTGRKLWEAKLPKIGAAYDTGSHQPGANATGSNYVTTPGRVIVSAGERLVVLDASDGRVIESRETSKAGGERFGYIAATSRKLLTGRSPMEFSSAEFDKHDIDRIKDDDITRIEKRLRAIPGLGVKKRGFLQSRKDWAMRELNRAISRKDMVARVPPESLPESLPEAMREEYRAFLERSTTLQATAGDDSPTTEDERLLSIHRHLLHLVDDKIPKPRKAKIGADDVWDGTASRSISVLGLEKLDESWSTDARLAFRHNAICASEEIVFAIDRLPAVVSQRLKRRGRKAPDPDRIVAFDLESGRRLWEYEGEVHGTFLSYSAEHDILVESGRSSRDALSDEPGDRLTARRGKTGQILWDVREKYGGPIMLWHDTIFAQTRAFSLLDGKPKTRVNPLTGRVEEWSFARKYGCTTAIASEHLLTFRSGAAGFFDLSGDSGTANLGGFRASCTQNLIVADGVLASPDYTRSCTCSYPNQSSIAFVHDPAMELWTFQRWDIDENVLRRIGVNLAAPGDRRDGQGTVWLEFPIVGGPSPKLDVVIEPQDAKPVRKHLSRFAGLPYPFVVSSGFRGVDRIRVPLSNDDTAAKSDARRYRVTILGVSFESIEEDGAVRFSIGGKRISEFRIEAKPDRPTRLYSLSVEASLRELLELSCEYSSPALREAFVLAGIKIELVE